MQKDYLLKVVDKEKQVRLFLATTKNLVEEAHRRHDTSATASAALGRVLTAAIMMGSDMKGDNDALTLQFKGNGPGGNVIATADSMGHVRGLIANPQADLPSKAAGKLAVGDLVGSEGTLEVIKDLGLKQPFIGTVPLESGEIGEDLARYFMDSEQIPALVSLGVLVAPDLSIQSAGGLIVQALPGAEDALLEILEQNILDMGPLSSHLNQSENLESILETIMRGIDYSILGQQELSFQCSCSHDRLIRILAGLPEDELSESFEEDENIEVTCNFCNEVYSLGKTEVDLMRKKG